MNYTLQTKLPAFPKELQENTSMIRKGLEKVSAFAVSKYLMEDLINTKPLTILKNVATFFKIVKGFVLIKSSIKYLETAKAETFSNPFLIIEVFSCNSLGNAGNLVCSV